ncbi:LysR substrate-binding domain-containing protein [Methylobacterium sp. Leaf93]|uniref:LysR substrate-binding domain-containing protein n=1 Tax=Methylobacterium sp. Leaf93 TaxID=1736249 RepID=UPI000A6FE3E7|nr:LysR substrate-binding domain-containing protein [Methylobacterium sp. Leaf93]
MMRFDLVDLGLFRHVAEAGSITHGAARANLALAAASSRIRAMEVSLGAALLSRSRQGVVLTPAGRALLAHARSLLEGVDRMQGDLAAYAGGAIGQIKVLSNTHALTEFLPEALSAYLALHTGVSVDIVERTSDEIVGLVAEGAADLGIVSGTVDTGTLETHPFRQDRFVAVLPSGHPLGERDGVLFADVLDYDLVGLDRASAITRFLADKAMRTGRPLMRLRVQLRGFDAVCRLVECGVGLGIVPETTARRAARSMGLDIVPLLDPWAARDLTICLRSLEALPVFAREFVAHLRVGASRPGLGLPSGAGLG